LRPPLNNGGMWEDEGEDKKFAAAAVVVAVVVVVVVTIAKHLKANTTAEQHIIVKRMVEANNIVVNYLVS